MDLKGNALGIAGKVEAVLPNLRRHARALTGSQSSGDALAIETLEAILTAPDALASASSVPVGVFRTFADVWLCSTPSAPVSQAGLEAMAQAHLRNLTSRSRMVLLLECIEEFSVAEIAEILRSSPDDVVELLAAGRAEITKSVAGRIMVIEDEAMIAMDLQDIIQMMGHSTSGTAATRDRAVNLAARERPDLILSDIQLADGSSGIDAVDDILNAAGEIPVIFITAFPERLLTGERREPAFVITKPYRKDQVRSAIGQAMFFRSSAEIDV